MFYAFNVMKSKQEAIYSSIFKMDFKLRNNFWSCDRASCFPRQGRIYFNLDLPIFVFSELEVTLVFNKYIPSVTLSILKF